MSFRVSHWQTAVLVTGFTLALTGVLSACSTQPDALSKEEKNDYCTQLVSYVKDNQTLTSQLEENLSDEFHMKSEFASRAYWIYGYINESGQIAIKPQFMQAEPFVMGYARASRIAQPPGFIDATGETVLKGFANARRFTYGLAAVQMIKNGPWGYMAPSGKMVIPAQYTTAHEFTDSRARVEKDGKWGYIDVRGKQAVPLVFDWAEDFYKGEAVVRRGLLWWKIDRFGKQVSRKSRKRPEGPPRDDGKPANYKGLEPFTKNRKVGYKNQGGEEVIKPQFDSGDYFTNGLARVGYVCTPPEPEEAKEKSKH